MALGHGAPTQSKSKSGSDRDRDRDQDLWKGCGLMDCCSRNVHVHSEVVHVPVHEVPVHEDAGNPVFDRASGGWGRVRVQYGRSTGYRGTRGPLGRQRSSERVRSFGRHFQKKVAHQSDQSEIEIEIGIDGTRDSAWNVRVRTSITPTPPQRPRAHAPSQSSSHSGPPPRPLTA